MDTYKYFFQGVRGSLNTSSGASSFLLFLLIVCLISIFIWLIYRYYNDSLKARLLLSTGKSGINVPPRHISSFNPLQKKAVFDIIAEFKKKELIAEAIPVAVLERFSEFFYNNLNRVRISNRQSQRMAFMIYPVTTNTIVEIEFYLNNILHVHEKKILSSDGKVLVVNKIEGLSDMLKRGMPVIISYSVNNQFISGDSVILSIQSNDRMALSYPRNLIISDVRRFVRVPLNNVEGNIVSARSQEPGSVKVKVRDVSLEGTRVNTEAILKKFGVYKLSFEDKSTGYAFQNFECIVSKNYLCDGGCYEYGMSFVYLDLDTRSKLIDYLRVLTNRLKQNK
jgi:hypothetical protein